MVIVEHIIQHSILYYFLYHQLLWGVSLKIMGTKDLLKTEIALKHSLFIVSLWDDDKLIGFGRIVGDQKKYILRKMHP